MKKSVIFCLAFFGLQAIWVVLFFLGRDNLTSAFLYFSFYVLLSIFLLFLWSFCRFYLAEVRGSDYWALFKALVTGFTACVVVYFSVEPEWRVLSDETNLASVARSFFEERSAHNITMGKNYFDLFQSIQSGTPTRPLLYPFLTSLMHTLWGYNYKNAFALNFLFAFGFFSFVSWQFFRRHQNLLAISAVLSCLSFPIITLNISSGGFDFFSAAAVIFCFYLTYLFCQSPSAERLLFLTISLVALAHIRYESVLCLPFLAFGLMVFGLVKWSYIKQYLFTYALLPLLLSPVFVQRFLVQGQYENPEGGPPLAIKYFWKYLKIFGHAHIDFTFRLPYATAYLWFAFALVLVVLIFVRLQFWQKISAFLLVSLFVVLNCVFLMHHFGDATHPSQARFFVLWCLVWALFPSLAALMVPRIRAGLVFFVSLAAFIVYHPLAVRNTFMKALILPRETRLYLDFLERTEPDKRILIVYERPGQLVAAGYGSVDFSYARVNFSSMRDDLKRGLYRKLLVIQRINLVDGRPISEDAFIPTDDNLASWQSTESQGIRISQVRAP